MIDARGPALLQDIVRREGRSLLQYVSDAFPWTTPGEQAALADLQLIIDEERRAADALAQFLVRRRIAIPYLGSYPLSFTTNNYVSLDHLLPLLADHQRRAIKELEGDLQKLADSDARAPVRRILETKQRHLERLESMAAAHPVASSHQPTALDTAGPTARR